MNGRQVKDVVAIPFIGGSSPLRGKENAKELIFCSYLFL